MTTIDFAKVRPLFGGKLTQPQVDGINIIVSAFDRWGDGNLDHLAYLLATAKWETAHTMQPISERGAKAHFDKYEPSTKIGKALGNTQKGDGYLFRGRGYVQLTGRANYQKASVKLRTDVSSDTDLVHTPDRALEPVTAARILIRGCIEGWFTGKKLSDYATFLNMRRVVNGLDHASEIAKLADGFRAALFRSTQFPPAPAAVAPIPVETFGISSEPAKESPIMTTHTAKDVQNMLKTEGYDPGEIDGQIGPKTSAALKAYQQAKGLSVTGIADQPTLTSLFPAPPVVAPPRTLQASLADYWLNLIKGKTAWAAALMVTALVSFANTKWGLHIDQQTQAWLISGLTIGFGLLIGVLQTFFNSPHVATSQPGVVLNPSKVK